MSLAAQLAGSSGLDFGTGDGMESGPFVARIAVAALPGSSVSIDYEATSREQGVQHQEHAVLSAGPDGRDRLYVAHSESPFLTEFIETAPDTGRFVQPAPAGPYVMAVVIETPEPYRLTYAWWWAAAGESPTEQSKADVRRP